MRAAVRRATSSTSARVGVKSGLVLDVARDRRLVLLETVVVLLIVLEIVLALLHVA